MRLKNRCGESGDILWQSPWWLKEGERFRAGHKITCACGKTVKLRSPLNQGSLYVMIPHHNKGER